MVKAFTEIPDPCLPAQAGKTARPVGSEPPYAGLEAQIKEIIFLLRRLIQAEAYYTKELEKGYRVSIPQLFCLLALHEQGPMPPSQIAKSIMVNSSTVTGIIDRLEQKGLVARSRNSLDRRVITITLTETGRNLAEIAPYPIESRIVDGFKNLPYEERERIIHALRELSSLLDNGP